MYTLRHLLPLGLSFALGVLAITPGCATPRSAAEVQDLQQEIQAGETQKLSRLLSALESRDPEIREAAVRALADLGAIAVDPLKATVEKHSSRSGPALLALGLMGDPDHLDFIRGQRSDPKLSAYARQAERVIEDKLYQEATGDGGIAGMDAYLEAFPEGSQRAEVEALRSETLARASFKALSEAPTLEDMREFLRVYPSSSHTEEVRQMLVRTLFAASRTALDAGEFQQVRAYLQEVATLDPRRGADVSRLRAESYLKEGDVLIGQKRTAEAMVALEEATKFPDVRVEAERRMARILVDEARVLLEAGQYPEGVEKADRAARFDATTRPEVDRLKVDHVRRLLAQVEDPAGDHAAAIGAILVFGDQAVRPMEEYLGSLFAQGEHARVEEVMAVLGVTLMPWRGQADTSQAPVAAVRVRDALASYIRSGFTTAITEVSRLFSSAEFRGGWEPNMPPLDPRRAPLVLRVEQITANYLGLLRLGLGFRALLGEAGLEVITGDPIPDDQLKARVREGDIGANPSSTLLSRVQLAGTYAAAMGELIRGARLDPQRVLAEAVRLGVPPTTPDDWMTLAEATRAGATPRAMPGAARPAAPSLVSVEADPRQVTLNVYDPVVEGLALGGQQARLDTEAHALALLFNLARLTYGLYPGIDKITLQVGTLEGRFEPQARFVVTLKGFSAVDAAALRQLAPTYGPAQRQLLETTWTRWGGGKGAP